MLSRVADSMFWLSRSVERAENIARFVDVNLNLTMDVGASVPEQWAPLVSTTGDDALFRERYGEPSRDTVLHWLTFDREYNNSILSCLALARENARTIRDYLSTAMWEELNTFYLVLRDQAERGLPEDTAELYAEVRRRSQLFVGVTDSTLSHGEGWHFARMGRLIERADKTSRILDVKYFLLLPSIGDVGSPLDIVQWSALLHSASALDMYRATHGRLSPSKVASFLLLDPLFPRSVHYCVRTALQSLHAAAQTPEGTYNSKAEKRLGRLCSELDYTAIEDIFDEGLHEFVDRLQTRLNEVGVAIHESLFAPSLTESSFPPPMPQE